MRMTPRQTFFRAVLPVALVIASIGVGTVGFHQHFHEIDTATAPGAPAKVAEFKRWMDAFYHAVGLPILENVAVRQGDRPLPFALEVGRLLGVLAFVYAIGLAVVAFAWRHLVMGWWVLLHRLGLAAFPGHAVVCGLGWQGRQLAEDLQRRRYWVAVIERDENNAFLPWCAGQGIHVVRGDAAEVESLRAAHVGHSTKIYVVCKNDDAALRTARSIAEVVGQTRREHPVECAVNFQSASIMPLLRHAVADAGLGERCGSRGRTSGNQTQGRLRVRAFQTEQTTARMFFERYPLDDFQNASVPSCARLKIFGESPLGMALLEQALRVCVFAPGKSFAASLYCPDPRGALIRFCDRFSCYQPHTEKNVAVPVAPWHLETVPEVAFHHLPGAISDLHTDGSALFDAAPADRVHFLAALDDGPGSAALLSAIAPKIGRIADERGFDAVAYYYFNSPDGKYRAALERSLDASIPGVGIRAFTDFLDGCTVAAVEARPLDDLAHLLNFHYAAPDRYAALRGRAAIKAAAELWENATTEEDRQFSRSAADHMPVKVRALGIAWKSLFDKRNGQEAVARLADTIAREHEFLWRLEHRRWCADHLLAGFQHGRTKRKVEREHPCLLPWEQLHTVEDERTMNDPEFFRAQARRMSSVIPRLVSDLRDSSEP